MTVGHVRDNFPRVSLTLPGRSKPILVEFLIDTGFEGELSLPQLVADQVEAEFFANRPVRLGDGSLRQRPAYKFVLEWDEEARLTEILILENTPLLGVELLAGSLLQLEMQDGGEVQIEPL